MSDQPIHVIDLQAQRKRLGISAAEYAQLVGVTAHTVYKWEHRTAGPRRSQLAAIAAIRVMGRREAKAKLTEAGAGKRASKGRKKK